MVTHRFDDSTRAIFPRCLIATNTSTSSAATASAYAGSAHTQTARTTATNATAATTAGQINLVGEHFFGEFTQRLGEIT